MSIAAIHPVFGDSPIPRYVQLADLFRQRIGRGIWGLGYRLPSLGELMRQFNVARVTVRQAIELLAREGLVSPQQGRGTFVVGDSQPHRELRVVTTLADLVEMYRGDKPHLLNLAESVAVPPLAEADGKAAGEYFYMRRVHSREGTPYSVISIFIASDVFRRAPKRFRREVVIPILVSLPGVKIARARQALTISTADLETAGHLGVPVNSPVANVRRIFTADDGTVIYFADATLRGDFVRLDMDLRA